MNRTQLLEHFDTLAETPMNPNGIPASSPGLRGWPVRLRPSYPGNALRPVNGGVSECTEEGYYDESKPLAMKLPNPERAVVEREKIVDWIVDSGLEVARLVTAYPHLA